MQESEQKQRSISRGGLPDHRLRRGVKALVTSSDTVLMLRERRADGVAFWTLPGGGVQSNETIEDALRRELREEIQCGAVVGESTGEFTYVHASRGRTVSRYVVFDCAITDRPVPNHSEGVLQCRWVSPRDPPANTLPQVRALLRRTDGAD